MTKPAETVTISVRLVWMTLVLWGLMFLTGVGLLFAIKDWKNATSDLKTVVQKAAGQRESEHAEERSFDCFEYSLQTLPGEPIYLCKDIPAPADVGR